MSEAPRHDHDLLWLALALLWMWAASEISDLRARVSDAHPAQVDAGMSDGGEP